MRMLTALITRMLKMNKKSKCEGSAAKEGMTVLLCEVEKFGGVLRGIDIMSRGTTYKGQKCMYNNYKSKAAIQFSQTVLFQTCPCQSIWPQWNCH